MKTLLRSFVPDKVQVPVKYMLNKLQKRLEPEMKLLPFLVRPGSRSIDVGGNRGQYTYALWRLGSRVDVFEPNPLCSKVLFAWAFNKESISVHTVGLSDKSGEAELHIPVDTFGAEHDASASLNRKFSNRSRDERVLVEALDSFKFVEVGFVKIDVEGHEYSVLKGGQKLFTQQRPSILVEVEQRHLSRPIEEVFSLVQSWGYCGFFLRRGALMSLSNFDVDVDQCLEEFSRRRGRYINNFLFLHEERISDGEYSDLLSFGGCRK